MSGQDEKRMSTTSHGHTLLGLRPRPETHGLIVQAACSPNHLQDLRRPGQRSVCSYGRPLYVSKDTNKGEILGVMAEITSPATPRLFPTTSSHSPRNRHLWPRWPAQPTRCALRAPLCSVSASSLPGCQVAALIGPQRRRKILWWFFRRRCLHWIVTTPRAGQK